MNFIYKGILHIKSFKIKVVITTIGVLLGVILYFYSLFLFRSFMEEKSFFNLFSYSLSVYFSYFFFRFFRLLMYSATYDVKHIILHQNKHISKWIYTKDESSNFRKDYNNSLKNDIIKNLKYLGVFILFMSIIFFAAGINSLDAIFGLITFSLIIVLAIRDFNSFRQALKAENIVVIFSTEGIVVSESFTCPFNIKLKKLTEIDYDKATNKIVFTSSELSRNQDGPDSVYTIIHTFPVPKRYVEEAEKLLMEIKTHRSF